MTLSNKIFRDFSIYLKRSYKFISIEDRWDLFNIYIQNPFKTWWKARKYFKVPKTSIKFFFKKDTMSIPAPYVWEGALGKILDLHISDLKWKDKWNSPRHEENPVVFICFFKKFGVRIEPRIYRVDEFGDRRSGDMEYWEYLLNFTNYQRGLKLSSFWQYDSQIAQQRIYGKTREEDVISPYKIPIFNHLFSLNKRGLKIFKRYYDKRTNSGNNTTSSEE